LENKVIHHESVSAILASDSGGAGWFDVIEHQGEFQVIDSDGGMVLNCRGSLEEAVEDAKKHADRYDQEKVDHLKAQWKADPAWDIETTEGFEKFRDELYIFRLETELSNANAEIQRMRSIFVPVARFMREIAPDVAIG
jgi:hypothetical protein